MSDASNGIMHSQKSWPEQVNTNKQASTFQHRTARSSCLHCCGASETETVCFVSLARAVRIVWRMRNGRKGGGRGKGSHMNVDRRFLCCLADGHFFAQRIQLTHNINGWFRIHLPANEMCP